MTIFVIGGAAVHDIASLYDELNRLFMSAEDWRLGASLDALDDLLSGGFGALHGVADARVVWMDHAHSRRVLGTDATSRYYREKLSRPDLYDAQHFRPLLDAVEAGTGATYFDIVLAVFAGHPQIELVLA
ncbi:ribonuclease inhibitor [Microbacterium sp. P01]|uniref:ribonuclease inhibitor n=1 Tax=Microbacterium sp. P01 TaxID=3366261 RepID=UPI00366D35B4